MGRPLSPLTNLILSLPSTTPVSEVIAKAKEKGLTTSAGNVHQVRSKYAGRKPGSKSAPKSGARAGRKTVQKPAAASSGSSAAAASKPSSSANSKADYVRSLGFDVKPAEIIERGKRDGMKLTLSYIYSIRKEAKKAAKKSGPKGAPLAKTSSPSRGRPPAARATQSAASTPAPARRAASSTSGSERAFVEASFDMGLGRAQALLDALRDKVKSLSLS